MVTTKWKIFLLRYQHSAALQHEWANMVVICCDDDAENASVLVQWFKMSFPVLSGDIRIYRSTLAGCLAGWEKFCVCSLCLCHKIQILTWKKLWESDHFWDVWSWEKIYKVRMRLVFEFGTDTKWYFTDILLT